MLVPHFHAEYTILHILIRHTATFHRIHSRGLRAGRNIFEEEMSRIGHAVNESPLCHLPGGAAAESEALSGCRERAEAGRILYGTELLRLRTVEAFPNVTTMFWNGQYW